MSLHVMPSNTVKILHIGFRYCETSRLNSNQLWIFKIKLTVEVKNDQAAFSRLRGDVNRKERLPLQWFSSAFPPSPWVLWDRSAGGLQFCCAWLLPLSFHALLANWDSRTRKEQSVRTRAHVWATSSLPVTWARRRELLTNTQHRYVHKYHH